MCAIIHSPLQRLRDGSRGNILVKRDDLIDPFISGNKWRKLKYILEKAELEGKSHLVTFGGAYSNHLLATAAAAASKGLKCSAFVRGEEANNEMLVLCKLYGMKLLFTDRMHYRDKAHLFKTHFGGDPDAYFVDEGGAGAEGARGCSEIIGELPDNIEHLFCAAGTGTTAAGLLKGIHDQGRRTMLHVVPVLRGASFISDAILRYTGSLKQLMLHEDYHFGGYAKTTPDLMAYIRSFVAAEGILIDPVYTAKMFFAIDDLRIKGSLDRLESVVALHTGGLFGILGMKEKLA
ncbi:1-aminocyclopropane-1-carboxylate deaminase/D-cysteine desulfhydrase [Pedobacter faecalis]|uniref:1-aminocyclopropane-1-carboxylate deaminase/D-cysteine desulfhydrase n=1 Tax=Pedobacter faecalis TaxID=3041495 RepID=UPI00254BC8B5|nr:pyridoxal-phosphate dependent enzyme [Pedobacter sp. ELA7]